jgi:hypothetical protein
MLKIALTENETALLEKIDFTYKTPYVGAMMQAGKELTHSLLDRNAIPQHRIRFFTDPAYSIDRRSSVKQRFERNTNDVYGHPDFLKYLHYFVFGPSLPVQVIQKFEDEVRACGNVTSGDTGPLTNLARTLRKQHGLDPRDAAEEFYKLCLEFEIDIGTARSIRDSVRVAS